MPTYREILRENATIETKRLLLRPFRPEDREDVLEYGQNPQPLTDIAWEKPSDSAQAEAYIRTHYLGQNGTWAIVLKSEEKCIGAASLEPVEEEEKTVFACILGRDYWGGGFAAEAIDALLELSFLRMGAQRVEASSFLADIGAGKVLQHCGLIYEGPEVRGTEGERVQYGIIRSKWKALQRLKRP